MGQTRNTRIPLTVYEQAEDIKEEYGYPSIGEAIRHVFREEGYDV